MQSMTLTKGSESGGLMVPKHQKMTSFLTTVYKSEDVIQALAQ